MTLNNGHSVTTATTTLTDFLLARIAEDEHLARLAREAGVNTAPFNLAPAGPFAPARVLAECEANERIVGLHADDQPNCMGGYVEGMTHRQVIESERLNSVPTGYCDTLRALAAIYSDHPDYRDEWRP